ncbi:MAG: GNAT family N-acetyltransferase [Chloroflexi bacterium]|nr:GNAT family N-acetyltransferase [Chloroflexota bacterium]
MLTIDTLPGNLLVRRPTMDDLKSVYELVNTCDLADNGMPDHTLDELRAYWQSPDINLATDAWTVVNSQGQLVAYADTDSEGHGEIFSFIRVLPEYRNRGLETHLLQQVERRALERVPQAPANVRIALYNWISHSDKTMPHLLEQQGFKQVRSFWRMELAMGEAPGVPEWPESITLRTLRAGEDERTVFAMMEKAFQDHWRHTPTTFEQWARWQLREETFDPTLWFLAWEGDELVGGSLCRYEKELDLGWVGQLAVLRPWRRKGLGMALLLNSFGEFYRRGIYKVGLGVDSQNLTGATRLYERAGMHVALQHDTYEKELRPGEEPGR